MPISVTLDSTACWLLNEPADLSDDVTLELRRRYVAEQGRTAIEERRTRQSADVAALKFTLTLEGSWGTAFRAMLRAYDMRPLLVPFWPALGLVSEISSTLWGSGLRVFFEPDWSAYEIRTDGATAPTGFAASASCCYAPLLWCVFNKLPGDPKALDGDTMELQLDLIEAGAAEYALSSTLPIQPLYGPSVGPIPRLILPAAADWSTAPKLGGIDILYERTQIGCVRQPVDKYAPQDPRRRSTLHLTYSPLELARLVALWQWSDGPVNAWWCEAGYSETTLVAATSSASVEIEVADAAPFASEPYLCLIDGEGLLVGRKIVSIAGNIITLAESPGDIPAEGARVTPLQMVRFSRDTLKIVWKGDLISIDIEVLEQPHETEAGLPDTELLGGTLGAQTSLWFGYLVTDGTRVWRYTSHDRAINCGAVLGTFIPKPIEHGDITMELNLERHDFDLTVGWWEGCPFFERQTDDAAPVLTVTIYEITAGAESAAKALVTGDVVPKYSGDVCQATVRGPEAVLDTKIPVQAISRRCWAPLYGEKCGLSRAALAVPVALVGVNGSNLTFQSASGLSAGALAGGYCEYTAPDGRVERHSIVTNPAAGAGEVSVTIAGTTARRSDEVLVYQPAVSGGEYTLLYVDSVGDLYAAGDGALGLGFSSGSSVKSWAKTASAVRSISAGRNNCLYLSTAGVLYGAGANSYGELGVGDATRRWLWAQSATGVAAMACGYMHSLYVSTGGDLYAAGRGTDGQFGDGLRTDALAWRKVAAAVRSVDCALSQNRSYYISLAGALYGTGDGSYGEFGIGWSTWQLNTWTQLATSVAAVSSGRNHTLYLTTSGDVYASGSNYAGQLGTGDTNSRGEWVLVASGATSIAASYDRSFYAKADGTLWAAGNAYNYALGNGSEDNPAAWTLVATDCREVVKCGNSFASYISTSGALKVVGDNSSGQLGLGSTTTQQAWITSVAPSSTVVPATPTVISVPATGWVLYPGCDKSWGRCQALGNSDNFRGRPWLPKTNPALVAVSSSTSSGSKK